MPRLTGGISRPFREPGRGAWVWAMGTAALQGFIWQDGQLPGPGWPLMGSTMQGRGCKQVNSNVCRMISLAGEWEVGSCKAGLYVHGDLYSRARLWCICHANGWTLDTGNHRISCPSTCSRRVASRCGQRVCTFDPGLSLLARLPMPISTNTSRPIMK